MWHLQLQDIPPSHTCNCKSPVSFLSASWQCSVCYNDGLCNHIPFVYTLMCTGKWCRIRMLHRREQTEAHVNTWDPLTCWSTKVCTLIPLISFSSGMMSISVSGLSLVIVTVKSWNNHNIVLSQVGEEQDPTFNFLPVGTWIHWWHLCLKYNFMQSNLGKWHFEHSLNSNIYLITGIAEVW